MHLLQELTGHFYGPAIKRWYLSDGGHFENTAAYELLRRRVPHIIVCDSGCDPDYVFEDLGNLVRKARIDFGAEVEFFDADMLQGKHVPKEICDLIGTPEEFRRDAGLAKSNEEPKRVKHNALVAQVKFPDGASSFMLFLKPGVEGDEPLDVLEYQRGHLAFPNESTADQYFDEAQWESYRRLGEHISHKVFACLHAQNFWFLKLS
jgi:hypothetical protein